MRPTLKRSGWRRSRGKSGRGGRWRGKSLFRREKNTQVLLKKTHKFSVTAICSNIGKGPDSKVNNSTLLIYIFNPSLIVSSPIKLANAKMMTIAIRPSVFSSLDLLTPSWLTLYSDDKMIFFCIRWRTIMV